MVLVRRSRLLHYICCMQQLVDAVSQVYRQWSGKDPATVDVLPQSGSDRRYFRMHDESGNTVIATYGINVAENDAFIYFADHFAERNLPVPKILAVGADRTTYLQQDLGDTSLL